MEFVLEHLDDIVWILFLVLAWMGKQEWARTLRKVSQNEFLNDAIDFAYAKVKNKARKGDGDFDKVAVGLQFLDEFFEQIGKQPDPEEVAKAKAVFAARHENETAAGLHDVAIGGGSGNP